MQKPLYILKNIGRLLAATLMLGTSNAFALSVELDGTRTVLTGTDCDIATYRFGTNAVWNGTPLDLHVVVNAEDNDLPISDCVFVQDGILSVRLRDTDAGDDVAFTDVTVTLVAQGTLTPVYVDRITATGFDLDSSAGTGTVSTSTDDIYLSGPGASYVSGVTNVIYSEGAFAGGHDVKLKGQPAGNCTDSPASPVPSCRASASWTGGTSNAVASISARFQNDNAYGQYTGTFNALRLLQLSLMDEHAAEILTDTDDYGDAPLSYGDAWHPIISLNTVLGYGLGADHEFNSQPTILADGDDLLETAGRPTYDDEDTVLVNGAELWNAVIAAGQSEMLDITTFGTGYLTAWVDFNADGDFLDAGEQFINDVFINSTTVETTYIPVQIPLTAPTGNSFARFRFNDAPGLGPTGAGGSGEIEDYLIRFVAMQPEFNMVKTSDMATMNASGVITYTFTFTNSGNVNLTNLTVADPDIDSGSLTGCPIATLGENETATCTAIRTVSQGLFTGGGAITNTAVATAVDPAGQPVDDSSSVDDNTSTTLLPSFTAGIVKSTPTNTDNDSSGDISEGDTLTYNITATNTGTGTLSNVEVLDTKLSPSSTVCATLVPADTCVLIGTYVVSAADVSAGSIDNSASVSSNESTTVSDAVSTPLPNPAHSINKPAPVNADEDGSGDISLGDTLTYTITAINTGAANLTNLEIIDNLITPSTTTCASVAPGANCVLAGTYVVTAADMSAATINNTASAESDQTALLDDTEIVSVPTPAQTLAKAVTGSIDNDSSSDLSSGDEMNYAVTATNTGTAVLTNMFVTDTKLTPSSIACASVAPGDTCVLNGTYIVTNADVLAGKIVNTANLVSDQASPADAVLDTPLPIPAQTLVKSTPVNDDADGNGDISLGDTLTYTLTQTNSGAANLTNVRIEDAKLTPDIMNCGLVLVGDTCELVGTYAVTAADVTAGSIVNNATAFSDQAPNAADTETVVVTQAEIQIIKSLPANADEDGSADYSVGDTLTYTITSTNSGTANLTNVVVSDAMLTPATASCATLASAATCVLTGTYVVTTADVVAGSIVNTASVGTDQTPIIDDTVTITTPLPSHSIDKAAPVNADEDSTLDISAGDTLTYTITATNNGTAILTNLVVSDPMITPSSLACASVAPAGTCVLTGTYTVTSGDPAAGSISNTASAVSDQTPLSSDTEIVTLPTPSHSVVKAAPSNADDDTSGDVSEGDTLTYTIIATNTGAATLTNMLVSDPMLTPNTTTCASLAPTSTCVLTGTYVVSGADVVAGSIDNTASAASDQTAELTDTETVILPTPAHTMDKAAPVNSDEDGSSDISLGDTLTYTITATSTGTAVLTNLTITDSMLTPSSNTCASVALGAICVLTGTHVVTTDDILAGSIVNTAYSDSDQTVELNDIETVGIPQPSHAIDKPAPTNADEDASSDVSVGDTLTYNVTVTNTGSATLTNMVVSDPMLAPATTTCASLAPAATCVLSGTYLVTAGDVAAGVINNTASSDSDQTDSLTDSETVNVLQPALSIDKPAPAHSDTDSSADISVGDTLTYTVTTTNTGTATLTNVVVSDPLISPASTSCASVAAGATCVLTGTYVVTASDVAAGTIDNTASTDSDQTDAAQDTATVVVPVPSLAINKPAPVNGDQDSSADVSVGDVLTYTITATNTGTANLANVIVSDPMITPNSLTCPSVAVGGTCVLTGTYMVTAADTVAGFIDNTASADSDQTGSVSDVESVPVPTPAHSISKPAPAHIDADSSGDISAGDTLNYAITVTNTGTATLTNMMVSDPLIAPNTITCASVAPSATCVLNGSYVVTSADVATGSIINTASSESDQTSALSDDETVTLPAAAHTLSKPAPVNGDEDGSTDVSVGDILTYTITATNTGAATLTNLVVSDPLILPTSTSCATVGPAATCVLVGTYTVTAADVAAGTINNTASSESDQTLAVTDSEVVPVFSPSLSIDKPAPVNGDQDSSTDVSAGDVLTYTITATNTGTATLTNVLVSDPLILPTGASCASLAPSAVCVLTGTYAVTAADIAVGAINNTASAISDQTGTVTDVETVAVPSPQLAIDKPAPTNADGDISGDVSVGDVLTYTVTATNTGTAALTNVVVNDPLLTLSSTSCAALAPGATCVLIGDYTVAVADITAGVIDNTASTNSDQTDSVSDTESVVVPNPSHILSKGVPTNADEDGTGDVSEGDTLTYTITASNNGTATLTNMVVSDPLITPSSISCTTVAPSATCVLVGTYVVTAADVSAGMIDNTASADTDQTDLVTDSESVNLDQPSHAIDKAAPSNADEDGTGDISVGDTLTYTITATNNGAATITNLVVSDPMISPSSTTCGVVAPTATCVLAGTYVVTAADVLAGVITNTASSDSDQTELLEDTEIVNLLQPAIAIDKPAPANSDEDGSTDISLGDTLTYTVTATNSGLATLTNMVVSDPLITPTTTTCGSVAAGATCVLVGTYVVTAADVLAAVINNTASTNSDQTGSVSDTESVVVPTPGLAINKPAPVNGDQDSSADVSVGDVLTYTITATNNGTASLTNVVVDDPMLTPSSNSCSILAAGVTCVLTGTYTVTAADVAAGTIDNTATANSDQTGSVSDVESVTTPTPVHAIDKSAPANADEDNSTDVSVGDTLTYTITATNTGTATLTNMVVSDAMITPATTTCASLAPAANCVLVGTYVVTAADIVAGAITNTASSESDQSAALTDIEVVTLQAPALSILKPAPLNGDDDSSSDVSVGDVLTYTITATNSGAATLTNVVVNDPLITPASASCAALAPSATCVLVGTYTVTSSDVTAGAIDNTATADSDQTVAVTDDETVPVPVPGLAIDKPAPANGDQDSSGDVSVGDILTYTITATNSGSATLTNLIVNDLLITPATSSCASVAPAATCVLVGTYTVTASDVIVGAVNNTATAESDQTPVVSDDETVPVLQPQLALDKAAPTNADGDNSTDISAGDVLTYTITATNSGTANLTDVVVSDPMLTPNGITCPSVSAGSTCVLSGIYTATAGDVMAGVINNTASADSDQTGPVADTETVVVPEPSHILSKAVPTNSDEDGSGDVSAGDTLTYTITATNNGTAVLTNMVINDPKTTPNNTSCASVAPASTCVLVGAYVATAADVVAGVIANTASADTDQTDSVNDSQSINLNQPSHAIDKSAPINSDEDGSGDISVGDTLTYTITATNNGAATLTNLVVSDPMITPATTTCTTVASAASCALVGTYVVVQSDVTAGVISNTASSDSDQTDPLSDTETVNLLQPLLGVNKPAPTNADEDGSTDLSVGDTLTYTVTATNTGMATLTDLVVSDPLITPNTTTCGNVVAGATCVLVGTYVVTPADVLAGSINNTASADSDQTVSVTDNAIATIPTPSLALNKPAPVSTDTDSSGDVSAGDVLTYTVTATNNGAATLTNVVVSDPLLTPNTNSCSALIANATCVLTGTYTVTSADVVAGKVDNIATADSDQTPPVTDDETVTLVSPNHTLDKAVPVNADEDNSTDMSVGDTLTYTITATNSGTANLTNMVVSDPLITPTTTTCAALAPAATCVLVGTYSVTAADVVAGTIANTATSDTDQTEPVDDTQTVSLAGPSHAINKPAPVNTDADSSTDISAGDTLTYTITATNNGTANLTNLMVSDPMITPSNANCALVVPGATCVLIGTYVVTAADVLAGSIDNIASSESDQTGALTDDELVVLPIPSLSLDKPAPSLGDTDATGDVSVGDVLTYTITATNTGTAVLTNLLVSDSKIVPSSLSCASVAPGATCVLAGDYTVVASDISAGSIMNTATADSDQTVAVTDDEIVSVLAPLLILDKATPTNADGDSSTDVSAGDVLTYTITATNSGAASLTNVVVSDSMLTPNAVTCSNLTIGSTCVLTGTYTATAGDVAAGVINNTATANSDQTPVIDDSVSVVVPAPSLTLSKAAPVNADIDGSGDMSAGDVLTYTITATNNGTAILTNLVVSDPLILPTTQTCASVAVGATCVLVGDYTVQAADVAAGVINNTASADSDQTDPVDDSVLINLNAPSLSLDKPAPTNSDEDNSGDVSVGDTLTYTITATNDGAATLTNVLISDPMIAPTSINCPSVAPGTTCVLVGTYVVTPADVVAGAINNTASADADQTDPTTDAETVPVPMPVLALDKLFPVNADEDGSLDVSAADTLSYTVTATNTGTATLTNVVVSDPLITPNSMSCASVAPGATCVLLGDYTVTAADVASGVINNTASSNSDQTLPVTDTETVPVPTPALSLDKPAPVSVDQDGSTDLSAGDVLTYSITATNTGTATLTNLIVSDPLISPSSITCASVAAGDTCILVGNYTVTAADVSAGVINNTATSDSDQTDPVSAAQSAPLPTPEHSLTKAFPTNADEDGSTDVSVGDTLTYIITATNTGTAQLSNLVINDALIAPTITTCALVAPSATCVLTGAYTVTVDDVALGIINNTATSDSDQSEPVDDTQSIVLTGPSHVLDKSAPVNTDEDGSTDISAGDTLTYTITATNNGSANLSNMVVSDPMITPTSHSCALLLPAETCVLIGTYTVSAADVAAGSVDNTASSVTDQTAVVVDDETVVVPMPALAINKIAPVNTDEDGSGDISAGDTLTYTVTATNSGTASLTNLIVTDAKLNPVTNTCALVASGATCILVGTYSVTAGDVLVGSIVNTASADSDQTDAVTDTETTPLAGPALSLDKALPVNADEDGSTDISLGDTLTYTVTATNTGDANLTNLVVSDSMITPNTITCASVSTAATCVLIGTYVVEADDISAGFITNTASSDSDQTDSLTDDVTVLVTTPSHSIDKPAPMVVDTDNSTDISVGDVLNYTVTATNTGTARLTNLVVTDSLITPSTNTCALVLPGATCVLTGSYLVVAADIVAGAIVNTASSDSDQTSPLSDQQVANVPAPGLQIDKPAPINADEDGSTDVSLGDTLTYTINATNNGTANLTNVVVSDALTTPSSTLCALVAPGSTCVLTGTLVVSVLDVNAGSVVNTASAVSDQTAIVDDTQTVTLPTPSQSLVKAAPSNADEDGSGDVSLGDTLTYVITATNNGTAVLTDLVVSDSMITPETLTCPSVAPGSNCILTGVYVVTATDIAAGSIDNTATSSSDQTDAVQDTQLQNLNGPSHTLSKVYSANADEDGSTDISAGDTLSYIITATNNGNANLTNLVVTDAMITPATISCALVAPGENCVLTGTYLATAADVINGSIDNTASSDSDQTEPFDDLETVVLPTPSTDIDKAVPTNTDEDGSGDISVGDTLNYVVTVTNNGTAVLTNVQVNDALITPSSQLCELLAPNAQCVLSGSYSVTLADVNAGVINNTANVDSDQTEPATDDVTINLSVPGIDLVKSLTANADEDNSGDIGVGDTLTYTVVATNTGATSLTNVVVNDALITPASETCDLLPTGGTCELIGTYVVSAADLANGLIDNTATVDSDQTEQLTDNLITPLSEPGLALVKTYTSNADEDDSGDISVDDRLSYTIVATNNGSSILTSVTITDNKITPSSATCAVLAPAANCALSGTYVVTEADVVAGVIDNTAMANSDQLDPVNDSVQLNLTAPAMTLVKGSPTNNDIDESGTVTPGDILSYVISATNTGVANLTNVVVSDPLITPATLSCDLLSPGQSCLLAGTYTVTAADAVNGAVINTASATSDQTPDSQATQTQPVFVLLLENPPMTMDDSKVDQTLGQPVTVSVLGNDLDPEDNIDPTTVMMIDPLTGESVTALLIPGEGAWDVDPVTGDITFTPAIGFVGDPTPIQYTVTDTTGLVSNPSTVTIDYEEPASLTGTVWLDTDRDGEIDADEEIKSGWTIEVVNADGIVVATTVTDVNGKYFINDLVPGEYTVKFYNNDGVFMGELQTDGPLVSAGTQDLPLPVEPTGVIYDSVSRETLAGVTLQLVNSAGVLVDEACLDRAQQGQTTPEDGLYSFNVYPNAHPSCLDNEIYDIVIVSVPPTHLEGYSTLIAPQEGVFESSSNEANCTVDSFPLSGACEVQAQAEAPQTEESTTYYSRMTLAQGDVNVIFNHLPIDPYVASALAAMTIQKTASRATAATGDVVLYSIRVENTIEEAAPNVSIMDNLPRGFRFVEGSANVLNFDANQEEISQASVASVGVDPVIFIGLNVPAFGQGYLEISYAVTIGSGVVQGDYANTAEVSAGGTSNISTARVTVVADSVLQQATLVGKVFHDRDGDGYQESAFASDVTIKSDYFGWSSYLAGDVSGRVSAFDSPDDHKIVVYMPLSDNNSFSISTAEGTVVHVDHKGTATESHDGKRARGITGQQLRISTLETNAVPTPSTYQQSGVLGEQPVLEITIENIGINEEGIPGVRLATVEGLLIETDQAGRFHLPNVDAGSRQIGQQFIVKLDKATLPDGAVFTTENPRVLRITNSALNTIRFGVKLPVQIKPAGAGVMPQKQAKVEATLNSVFFDTDMDNIRNDQRGVVQDIIKRIKQFKRAHILIEAHTDSRASVAYNRALAERRARSVESELRKVLGDALMENVVIEVDQTSYTEVPHNDPRAIDYQGDAR